MNEKPFDIDSHLAAKRSEDVFSENWSWPITQEQYDDPITEFIEWSDKLFEEIKDTPRLIDAFFLMRSVSMVPASFDEQNRVRINPGELHEALKKPVGIDARKQLIHDFLLRPSVDFRQVLN
mgnify:CR=1 FL=1